MRIRNKIKQQQSDKKYYSKNREQILSKKREYFKKNKKERLEYTRKYKEKNLEKILKQKREHYYKNKDRINKQKKENYLKNPEKVKEQQRKYHIKNKKIRNQSCKNYEKNNKEKICIRKKFYNEIKKLDYKFRLNRNIGSYMSFCLKSKKNNRKWESLVGYNLNELIQHLEKQFNDKMNWNNYGVFWHVDHIKPKSLFKYTSTEDEEFKKCWALKNLQPLEALENIIKGNRYEHTFFK